MTKTINTNQWKKIKLGDVCNVQTGPFGSQLHQKDYVLDGTPIITVEHLGCRKISRQKLPCVSDEDVTRLNKYTLIEGDVVFSRVGSVDRASYVMKEEEGWLFSGRCLRIRPIDQNVNSMFLYYYFCQDQFKEYVRKISVGATMPSLNTKILSDIIVSIPPLPIQRRIGEILGSFDAKIELNRRMNTTLEQIATALFKSWFVNFDPFKDGEFVKSELGLIPKGWKVVTIGEIATITSGKRPGIVSTKKKSDFEIPLIGASGVMGYVQQALSQSPILVTGRVGTLGIVRKYNIPIWSSDNTLNFTTNYFEYVLQILRNTNFKNLNRGSTQPLITQTDIKSIKIIFPEEKILTLFEQICLSYSDAVEHNRIESQTLAAIRDTLLPKLMSGEISVT